MKVNEPSTFPISLKPNQQAELYFDIELLICDSANTFLMYQYQKGRLSVDSVKKLTDFWKSKGRPQVVEFYYDQSSQRDLIVANQRTFSFYGPNANNPLKVHSMLYAWKTDAREMAIRTFCYPDSMIRKHIQDTFMIMDFLGGHPVQYLALQEVYAKFVKWVKEAKGKVEMAKEPTQLVVQNPWSPCDEPTVRPSTHINRSAHSSQRSLNTSSTLANSSGG